MIERSHWIVISESANQILVFRNEQFESGHHFHFPNWVELCPYSLSSRLRAMMMMMISPFYQVRMQGLCGLIFRIDDPS